jgi:hypothetical protein
LRLGADVCDVRVQVILAVNRVSNIWWHTFLGQKIWGRETLGKAHEDEIKILIDSNLWFLICSMGKKIPKNSVPIYFASPKVVK